MFNIWNYQYRKNNLQLFWLNASFNCMVMETLEISKEVIEMNSIGKKLWKVL